MLRDIEIRSKPRCVVVGSPSVISSVARLRAGVASTSVAAEDGLARRLSRRLGKGIGGR